MAKLKRDAQATKTKIVSSAIELFSKRGFDAVSMDELAHHSGVNKAMIFYYFKNKAGLYESIMKEMLDSIYAQIEEADRCCENVLGELRAFIATYAAYAKRYPGFSSLFLREISDSGAHIPELMFESMQKLFLLLSSILKRGEEQGIFKDVIPMVVHFMIVGAINMLITTTPIRRRAHKEKGIDTCFECPHEEIVEYIYKKVLLMLEVENETICTCA